MSSVFRHLGFYVNDIDIGIPFYNILGYEEFYRAKENWPEFSGDIDILKMRNNRDGSIIEFIGNSCFPSENSGVHAAFTVDNMVEICKKLRNNKVIFIVEPKTINKKVVVSFCVDPYGFKIELVQEL